MTFFKLRFLKVFLCKMIETIIKISLENTFYISPKIINLKFSKFVLFLHEIQQWLEPEVLANAVKSSLLMHNSKILEIQSRQVLDDHQ